MQIAVGFQGVTSDWMNDLAKRPDGYFNGRKKGADRGVGGMLMVFPFGEDEGRCNYISNVARADVIRLL